jgi:hypothetical protein
LWQIAPSRLPYITAVEARDAHNPRVCSLGKKVKNSRNPRHFAVIFAEIHDFLRLIPFGISLAAFVSDA